MGVRDRASLGGPTLNINVSYPDALILFSKYRDKDRWDSAAFLIWYLEQYYRLESQEAVDSVCDRGNDGIDGIWVNDEAETIMVFQAKLFKNPAKAIGDNSLRTFAGTLRQLETAAGLKAMVDSAGMNFVASLVTRLDLIAKISPFAVRGEFVSNVEIDSNGASYLASAPNITFTGKN